MEYIDVVDMAIPIGVVYLKLSNEAATMCIAAYLISYLIWNQTLKFYL